MLKEQFEVSYLYPFTYSSLVSVGHWLPSPNATVVATDRMAQISLSQGNLHFSGEKQTTSKIHEEKQGIVQLSLNHGIQETETEGVLGQAGLYTKTPSQSRQVNKQIPK